MLLSYWKITLDILYLKMPGWASRVCKQLMQLYINFIRCTKITVLCKLLSYSLIQILCLFSSCQASFDFLWVSFIMSALSEAMQTSCRHPVMREVAIGQASWTTSICLICLIYHFHVNILHKCGLKMTFLDECCKTVNVSELLFFYHWRELNLLRLNESQIRCVIKWIAFGVFLLYLEPLSKPVEKATETVSVENGLVFPSANRAVFVTWRICAAEVKGHMDTEETGALMIVCGQNFGEWAKKQVLYFMQNIILNRIGLILT